MQWGQLHTQVLLISSLTLTSTIVVLPTKAGTPSPEWPQWGRINRDFKVHSTGLADHWPDEGPKRLWTRPLGEGYAAIVADAGHLFTMYRDGKEEVVIALRADTGETNWEQRYHAPPYPEQTAQFGQGPNATPLILDNKIITIGFTGIMRCTDVASGKLLWSHDLVRDFNGKVQYYGYANSPIAFEGKVIVLVGGKDHGVITLDPDDGRLVWKSQTCDISYAAPVLIKVDGQDQLVFFSPSEVIGIDPRDGTPLWSHKVINFCRTNCTQAIWGEDNLLWAATKGVGGTRVLELTRSDGKTRVKELWLNRKVKVYHWNAIRIGDYVYTSIGDNQKFLSVIDVKTGEPVQRIRGYGSTNGIYADGKLILLDDAGRLILADVSPGRINIRSTVQLLDSLTWTVPTLVGSTLFLRDKNSIMAFDLGKQTGKQIADGS